MNERPGTDGCIVDTPHTFSFPEPGGWRGHAIPLQDDLVVVKEGSSDLFVLNGTAQLIWKYWREGHDLHGITKRLSRLFAISGDKIASDIQQALAEWQETGLIGKEPSGVTTKHEIAPNELLSGQGTSSSITEQWHSEQNYQFFDCIIHMRFATEEIAKSLHPLFSHLSAADFQDLETITLDVIGGENNYELQESGVHVFSSSSLDALAMGVTSCVIQRVYHSGDNLIGMHAGAVAYNDHCIVMPGASGSGKSTITAALVHAGLTYLSDEVVPLDRTTLNAVPIPLCLNIKAGSIPVLSSHFGNFDRPKEYTHGQRSVYYQQPWNYSKNPMLKRYPVMLMVFPRYEKGAATTLTPLSATVALQRLISTKSLVSKPTDIANIEKLVYWIQNTPAFELKFESLHSAVKQIMGLFEDAELYHRSA